MEAGGYGSEDARCFAETLDIAPGIAVGRLQHEGIVPWSRLNGLKVRLQWTDD